jgi:hypothetical protein
VVILSIPTTVKITKNALWIHHRQIKPASPEWECIPDSTSPSKIILQSTCALPRQDFASQEITGDHKQEYNSPSLFTPKADQSTHRGSSNMGRTPALLYTLGLLPFGLALARFFPCTKCYKRAIVGLSIPPYFDHARTNRSNIKSAHIFPG